MIPLLTEIIVPLIVLLLCEVVALRSKKDSILSPLGMLGVTISCALMISPMFMYGGDIHGWVMVGFSVFFYFILVKSIKIYFKLNKL